MNLYKLLELLDLSIGTPEVGAVNFNALHLVLKTIIEQAGLKEFTVEWKEPEFSSLLRKVLRKKDFYDDDSCEDLKKKLQDLYQSKFESDRDSKAWTKHHCQELSRRMEVFQDELEKMVQKFEDFRLETGDILRRPRYEEGYKRERKDMGNMDKEELENTLDDMGEAIARVAAMLKDQKRVLDGIVNEERLRDLCLKIVDDRMTERENISKLQFQNLAAAVRNLQLIIKDVLYPEAPGVTSKCMTCGRKAHLPDIELLCSEHEEFSHKIIVPPPDKSYQGARRKANDRLKFTMLSLDRLKKDNESAFQDQIKDQAGNLLCNDLDESFPLPPKEFMAPLCHAADATTTFLPLRFMPDPNRRRILSQK